MSQTKAKTILKNLEVKDEIKFLKKLEAPKLDGGYPVTLVLDELASNDEACIYLKVFSNKSERRDSDFEELLQDFKDKEIRGGNSNKDRTEHYSKNIPLDIDSFKALEQVLYKAIKNRLVMVLDLDELPGLMNNALDCHFNGVSCSQVNKAMKAKIQNIKSKLLDNEFQKFVIEEGNNDFRIFGADINFAGSYINTYQKVARQLFKYGYKEKILEFMDEFHNEEDFLEKEIIENYFEEHESFNEDPDNEDRDLEDYLEEDLTE